MFLDAIDEANEETMSQQATSDEIEIASALDPILEKLSKFPSTVPPDESFSLFDKSLSSLSFAPARSTSVFRARTHALARAGAS